jgi:hypothetical protein
MPGQPTPRRETSRQSYSEAQASEETRRVYEEWLAKTVAQGFTIFTSQGPQPKESPFKPDRLTGPVQFLGKLIEAWDIMPSDARLLLGFEDDAMAEAVLAGRTSLRGVDVKARIAALFRIKSLLGQLLRDVSVERAWMRTSVSHLGNRSPIELLRDGSMESLLTLRQYVEHISGL